jgi:multiple sugar transport system substrate-binding protein
MQNDTHNKKNVSRRYFLTMTGGAMAGSLLAACGAQPSVVEKVVTVEVEKKVVETVEVQKEVVKEKEVMVTATPPAPEPVTIVATSAFPLNTWDGTMARSKDMLPSHVNLKVTQTQIGELGWSGYADQIITQIAGGEQLDVISIAVEGIALLGSKKILSPLDPLLETDTAARDVMMKDVHKTLRELLQYEGKQLEYPFSWNNMVTYYNTKIFQEKGIDPPKQDWTWDDFLQTCLKVANVKGTADDLYAYSFWGNSMFGMHAWLFTNETSALTDDWKDSNMLDPKVTETLQFLADLILKHKVAPNPAGWDEWGQFNSGHLAMRTCGRWCISGSLKEKFETYDLQYQPHKSGPYRTVVGADGWGIATMSRHTKEAWEVVKLLSGKEASLDVVKVGGNIPALRSVAETPEFKEYGPANTAIFYESLDYAKTVPSPANFNIVEPILNRHLAPIWNGEKTVKEAVQLAHTELQAEMDKLKK